ncbi:unnamed protein product [Leptidea sinapis]|uniref:Uncharacterized protein n=1 Tax=Leptidea sinapis TaxID=189913 RepID=A0A5E4Q6T8_9NEOP|nr:unnamed protein product [Leptidea sinapis]
MEQFKDLKMKISQGMNQLAMINICHVSEKAKMNVYETNLTSFGDDYEKLFAQEQQILDAYNKELVQKRAEEEEIEKQKLAKIMEQNEQQLKEALAIEQE